MHPSIPWQYFAIKQIIPYMKLTLIYPLILSCFLNFSCREKVILKNGNLVLTIDHQMRCSISSESAGAKPMTETSSPTEYLVTKKFTTDDFVLGEVSSNNLNDSIGLGKIWIVDGYFNEQNITLKKVLQIKLYDSFPGLAVMKAFYINGSPRNIEVTKWVNNHYTVLSQDSAPLFWSFQGGSTHARSDWVLPLNKGFSQQNYMGMNDSDYGGGIPVTDIWRRDQGMAVGHIELIPKLVSLPVEIDEYETSASVGVEFAYEKPFLLQPGDTLETLETFVSVHSGDYYNALEQYGKILRAKGLQFAEPEPAAYESSWCAWGYMRDVTVDEITGTLPKVKELGIKWVTIDDGFQEAEGDWDVNRKKFPGGNQQMKALVNQIHSNGLKAMIWWAPLAADPESKLLKENPDMRLITRGRSPQYITWWDAYYLSPADEKTIWHTQSVLDLFMKQWGFDGLKMDGQHLNAVSPDYNPNHKLTYPEESVEKLPEFFNMILKKATSIKPHAVIQNCPCGTCMSIFNMPYMNQAVASDPLSSWQIRHKGKTYKALLGKTAYFGDHVELSDGGDDFATSFGIGAVLGTKFTWPKENPTVTENNLLTSEKEKTWKKWFGLYHRKMLSREKYIGGLYDIGFDVPETHVIQKGDTLHYAFYNPEWKGSITLRGLKNRQYRVYDYENDRDLGLVSGGKPVIQVDFKKHLLLAVFEE